jgi:CO/xanthine dehydrogenase FAD-binding subunit
LAEDAIADKEINEVNAEASGEAALSEAKPLATNKYKIQVGKVIVQRTILTCK